MSRMRLVILTGLSGSGKSTAARAVEDEGFFVVDNLPLVLLPRFLELTERERTGNPNVAVVMDVRSPDFLTGYESILRAVQEEEHQLEIYFFEAADEILLRRFSETRRRHPLARTEGVPEGIGRERRLLAGLRNRATTIIDTSWLTPHQLRAKVVRTVRGGEAGSPLAVQLQSFGFRYGIPPGSDLVMDVRFLPNPHFIAELRPLTGQDPPVREFILAQRDFHDFMKHFERLLHFLLPQYQSEGKSYLTISIGCTGGRHRSVAVVEELRPRLPGEGLSLEVMHRDIAKA